MAAPPLHVIDRKHRLLIENNLITHNDVVIEQVSDSRACWFAQQTWPQDLLTSEDAWQEIGVFTFLGQKPKDPKYEAEQVAALIVVFSKPWDVLATQLQNLDSFVVRMSTGYLESREFMLHPNTTVRSFHGAYWCGYCGAPFRANNCSTCGTRLWLRWGGTGKESIELTEGMKEFLRNDPLNQFKYLLSGQPI